MAEERDYEHILTQLYTRKLTRKSFDMIRSDFKQKTGQDLCIEIRQAQEQLIRDIQKLTPSEKGQKLRTHLYKMIDYGTYLRFCPVKKT